jgi:hypothetical protein
LFLFLSLFVFYFFSFCTVWRKTSGNHRKQRNEADRKREYTEKQDIMYFQFLTQKGKIINKLKSVFSREKGKRKRVLMCQLCFA